MTKRPKVICDLCDRLFHEKDPYIFICSACREKVKICSCGSDDVQIDWFANDFGYWYEIRCACGKVAKSKDYPAIEINKPAKEAWKKWQEINAADEVLKKAGQA
jgi:hypothetical protein